MDFTIPWPDQSSFPDIHCAPGVLTDLETVAVDGLLAMPRIGLGVGGLLLGTRENGHVQVLKSVAIPCSHAEGPAFVLTAPEIEAARAARPNGHEPEREVVGWYCSKTNGPITMTDHDRDLFEVLCPESWQLALLIRPIRGNPTLAAFGVRETDESGSRIRFGIPQELLPPAPPVAQNDLLPETEHEPEIKASPVVKEAIDQVTLDLRDDSADLQNEPTAPLPEQPALPKPIPELPVAVPPVQTTASKPKSAPPNPMMVHTPVRVPMARSGTIFGAPEPGRELTTGQWWLIFTVALLLIIGAMAFATRDLWMPRPTRNASLHQPTSLIGERDFKVVQLFASHRVLQT